MESWRERKVEQLQCNYFVWQITLMTNSLKDKILVNVFSACMKSCNSLGRALFAWTACVVNSMHCNFPLISTLHTFSRPANFSKWTRLLSHPLVLPTLCTILGWRPCKRHTVLFLLKGSQDCDFTCFFLFFCQQAILFMVPSFRLEACVRDQHWCRWSLHVPCHSTNEIRTSSRLLPPLRRKGLWRPLPWYNCHGWLFFCFVF